MDNKKFVRNANAALFTLVAAQIVVGFYATYQEKKFMKIVQQTKFVDENAGLHFNSQTQTFTI